MKQDELVSYIIDDINSNLNRFVSIDELADCFGYEKSYIMKTFKKKIGITIKSYSNNRRILNSLKYLQGDQSLLKIALNNGFNSLEYYSEMFSKEVGVSPSTYRKYLHRKATVESVRKIKLFLDRLKELNIKLLGYRAFKARTLRLVIPKEKKYF